MSVDQRRLAAAHAAQDALQENAGVVDVRFVVQKPFSVFFNTLPVFDAYQVELLYGLIHRPFLAAGASG